MNGKIEETGFREESGHYQQRFYPAPLTDEQKKIAIDRANANLEKVRSKKADFTAPCGCCDTWFAIPTEVINISKEGMCKWCSMVLHGKDDPKIPKYVVRRRRPTVPEVIERHNSNKPLTTTEASVVVEALKQVLANSFCT
jgi:hypothetical protein